MAAPPPLPRRERPSFPTPAERTFSPPMDLHPMSPPIGSPIHNAAALDAASSSIAPDLCHGNKFGACLQTSYEAISKRHEEELHALESLRGHVFKRQRADKEYAEQLQRINQSCERSAQFPSSTTSPIVQVRYLLLVHAYITSVSTSFLMFID